MDRAKRALRRHSETVKDFASTAWRANPGPQPLMVWEDAAKTLGPNLHEKAPVATSDNKTTEEEEEEGWEESAAALIISGKTEK